MLKKQNDDIRTVDSLFMKNMLEMKVVLYPMEIGLNQTKINLQKKVAHHIEGKCIAEGYVKPESIAIQTYSSGAIKGDKIEFHVVFHCLVCNPVEGSIIPNCSVRSVTKAGIHANVYDNNNNIPVTMFVVRDHFLENRLFNGVKENSIITVKVIGSRFELNDECVEVLGSIIQEKN